MKKQLISEAYKLNFKSYFGLMLKINNNRMYYLWMCDLQKLLREKYDIHIWIVPMYLNYPNFQYDFHIEDFQRHIISDKGCKTYDQALEEALIESLKYIDRLKNK